MASLLFYDICISLTPNLGNDFTPYSQCLVESSYVCSPIVAFHLTIPPQYETPTVTFTQSVVACERERITLASIVNLAEKST